MKLLVDAWYDRSSWLVLLKPLSCIFQWLATRRRQAYKTGAKETWCAPVPVVIVGNISVGGVGKTPLVTALVEALADAGFSPGIVSRGYGSNAPQYPFSVTPQSKATESGDEPLLLARRTACPVVIDPNRVAATKHLLENFSIDIIVSDDGLQHYALERDLEIAVVDGKRGVGNGWCLPAGPLREPVERLNEVDWVVVNSGTTEITKGCQYMEIVPDVVVNLISGEEREFSGIIGDGKVHAVAGIGNPQRFYDTLAKMGYSTENHSFDDHFSYQADDIRFNDEKPVIMTEKDAVKCQAIADENCWYLKVKAFLPADFFEQVLKRVRECSSELKSH